jgi:hypothetical protein
LLQIWISRDVFGKDFDRDRAVETSVARTVYLAHPARADRGANFIRAEPGARGKCHYTPPAFYAITPD